VSFQDAIALELLRFVLIAEGHRLAVAKAKLVFQLLRMATLLVKTPPGNAGPTSRIEVGPDPEFLRHRHVTFAAS
jgi:hypothetical protein